MKTFGEVEMWFHAFLTLTLDVGKELTSYSVRFFLYKKAPLNPAIGNDPVWALRSCLEAKASLSLSQACKPKLYIILPST
jgi:hypothetical protein